jgi:hypothetical protein
VNEMDGDGDKEVLQPIGYIYFIRCPSNGRIKIGFSERDPDSRFKIFDIGSPVTIEKFALMRGTWGKEGELHSRFYEYRAKGEWFDSHDALLAYIRENARPWQELLDEESTARLEAAVFEIPERRLKMHGRIKDHLRLCVLHGVDPDGVPMKNLLDEKYRRLNSDMVARWLEDVQAETGDLNGFGGEVSETRLAPNKTPVPILAEIDIEAVTLLGMENVPEEETPSKPKCKRQGPTHRSSRYGPLQALLDQLAADKDTPP